MWAFVWPACIVLSLWMLDVNKIFDDWMNLVFCVKVPFLYSSLLPVTLYSQLWIWMFVLCPGRKEEMRKSFKSFCVHESKIWMNYVYCTYATCSQSAWFSMLSWARSLLQGVNSWFVWHLCPSRLLKARLLSHCYFLGVFDNWLHLIFD